MTSRTTDSDALANQGAEGASRGEVVRDPDRCDSALPQQVTSRRSRVMLFLLLGVAGCVIDLATKSWIFGRLGYDPPHDRIWIVQNLLGLETHLNEGALFGMGQGRTGVFALLSCAAILGIGYWVLRGEAGRDWLLSTALGVVSGGILGNLYDRLGIPGLIWKRTTNLHDAGEQVYAVRDWIHFEWIGVVNWPVFNIADSLLVFGAVLLVWHAVFGTTPKTAADAPRN